MVIVTLKQSRDRLVTVATLYRRMVHLAPLAILSGICITCVLCYVAGAAREGVVTYTALDASQHTQLPGSAPSVDPSSKPLSNKQPSNQQTAQIAAKQPPMLAFGAKQKSQAQPSARNERGASVKEDASLPKQAMGAANDAPQGKGSEHGKARSEEMGQTVAQDHKLGGLNDVPAQLPARQRQSTPVVDGRQQLLGSKAAPQGTGGGQSAGQAAKLDHTGGLDHCQEARPPFGLFPSTQQSSSQPSTKLPAVLRTYSATETPTLGAAEKAQYQQQQQQGKAQQGQMQSRKVPCMSPSESSSVRPPQDASRRLSTGHATAAGLNGLTGAAMQQPQSRADKQGRVVEGVHGKEEVAAAAAQGSGKKLSADAGWKPRRGRKSSPPAADSPALGVQEGTAPGCRESDSKGKDASKLDEQTHATGHAKGEHCSQLLAAIASVDQQHTQGSIEQQQHQPATGGAAPSCSRVEQQMGSTSGG